MPKLLYVTHKPFFPDSSGGAQRSTIHILQNLMKHGWEIEVTCRYSLTLKSIKKFGVIWFLKSIVQTHVAIDDASLGFFCRRKASRSMFTSITGQNYPIDMVQYFKNQLNTFKPDIVLGDTPANSPFIELAIQSGFPTAHLARSIPFLRIPSILNPQLHLIGNSPYTAGVLKAVSNKEAEVLLPGIDPQRYRVAERKEQYITFINPVPQKGVKIATEIARLMPEQQFLFVKGRWSGMRNGYLESLLTRARKLKNVEVWEYKEDIRSVYKLTKILLVPSQFIETFGRVVIEANINGIPVVAAHVGGLPYTLGKGGRTVVQRDNPEAYVDVLRKYCEDSTLYNEVSAKAVENSKRKEFTQEYQTKNLLRITDNIIQKSKN